jgi:hypothetical protein
VYVAGEAWCGTGARTAFLSMLDTQASTILWEKRIFDQGTSSSAVYALAVGGGKVAVAGARTLSTASSPVARVAQFSAGGAPLGAGVDLATPGPSAAHAIAEDAASGDLYVGATREDASGAVGSLTKFTSSLTTVWDQTLNGARIYGVTVLKDGVVAAGGTRRVLPFTPVTDPILNSLVGMRLNPSRGFLSRFDRDGTLRWHHYVGGEQVVGLTLEGQRELGSSVLANVVGAPPREPCTAPPGISCLTPPAASFVESFRIK